MYNISVQPLLVPIFEFDIWIQISDLAVYSWIEKMAKNIGNYVGLLVRSDSKSFDGFWKSYTWIMGDIPHEKQIVI